jgi:hypothetical protein
MRKLLLLVVLAVSSAGLLATAGVASAAAGTTARVVVRPVHADGRPVAGWHVVKESIPDFQCNGGASVSAVDPNIVFCGYSATYTPSCWKSANHTALCLRDPRSHTLYRIAYVGRFVGAAALRHRSPQAITLRDHGYCQIRVGGAWSSPPQHPLWYGTYGCATSGVYGPTGDGINRTVNPWQVHVWDGNNPNGSAHIVLDRVRTAYFVGTAA